MNDSNRIDFLLTAYLYGNIQGDSLPEINILLRKEFKASRVILRNRLKSVFGPGGSIGYRLSPNQDRKRNVLRMVLELEDKILERQIAKIIFTKKDFDFISLFLELKTNIPVNIADPKTIDTKHIAVINTNIKLFGLAEIYYCLSLTGILTYFCTLDSSIARAIENHIIFKATYYKKFYTFARFIRSYPQCNKKRLYLVAMKFSHVYSAKYALKELGQDPDLKSFSILL